MKQFKPLHLILNAFIVFLIATAFFAPTLELAAASFAIGAITGTALKFIPENKKLAFMAIQVQIWENHIEQEIFKDNTFLRMSHNADDNVINSRAVHIPQSGGSGNVVKNRTNLPASVRKRNDTDVIYLLDEYTTDPVFIPNADTKELSYDKRNSALGEDRDKIVETVAEETIYNWLHSPVFESYGATSLPAGNVLQTTGAEVIATAPGATGNRKAASIADLQRMQTYFRQNKRWFEGQMYCLLSPADLATMFPADSVLTATYMQNVTEKERREGVILKAQGWNIMTRNSVAYVADDGTIKAPGAVGAATDDEASMFWYKDAVEFAMGGVEAFENLRDPQYYGDIYSFLVRSGGRARRAGYEGIALLKQAKTA
ncbi:hypothetical protein [Zunongwangia sp. SCSIO 43204]|uniref:hypothetical protein n=1 Tax=Zunongwangia sp. SCSIO 43204 TaxID=2779359 RepID=UPI002103A798|nr:hypothetical protein [Zunongwangia sp. SCSIO 43204]